MDRVPSLCAPRILEVVIADQTHVRVRQRRGEPELVLVALESARPGEVAEIGNEDRRRPQLGRLAQQARYRRASATAS